MTPIVKLPGKPRSRFIVPVLIGVVLLAGALRAPRDVLSVSAPPPAHADAAALPVPPRLATLPVIVPHEVHSVDTAAAGTATVVIAHGPSEITAQRGTPVSIVGWAVDRGAHLPSSFVFAKIGSQTFVARVHLARQDVAVALASPAYVASGFQLDIDTSSLPLGRTIVELYGVDAAGKGRYDLHHPVTLTLTQS